MGGESRMEEFSMTVGYLKKEVERLKYAVGEWQKREEELMLDRGILQHKLRETEAKLAEMDSVAFQFRALSECRLIDMADLRRQLTIAERRIEVLEDEL